jgi:hypothetical protein
VLSLTFDSFEINLAYLPLELLLSKIYDISSTFSVLMYFLKFPTVPLEFFLFRAICVFLVYFALPYSLDSFLFWEFFEEIANFYKYFFIFSEYFWELMKYEFDTLKKNLVVLITSGSLRRNSILLIVKEGRFNYSLRIYWTGISITSYAYGLMMASHFSNSIY